ncbi:MAG: glycerate kinase [Actinobacteria bacterium]|nr:glycerate kinase [Actinomycetota bacterium]
MLDDGRVGVVEVARASGLTLVPPKGRDPWAASTRGTGELIATAAAAGVARILVSVGGSATTDGGAGAIAALAEAMVRVPPLTVLCDVATPYEDAAAVFGPQKGRRPAERREADFAPGRNRVRPSPRPPRRADGRLRGRPLGRALGGP